MEKAGLFVGTGVEKVSVSLKKAAYEIKVAGICGEIVVNQKFVNETSESIEAVYVFPKDEGAVIIEFSFETDGRRFRTTVEEKDEAFKHYDEAIKNGDGAALLDEVTRDLIQISVGNLKPGQEVNFTIRWVQELQDIDGKLRLFLPLARFPRYKRIDADQIQADVQSAGFAESVPYSMTLTLIWENSLISHFISTTHPAWETPEINEDTPNITSMKLDEGVEAFTRDLEIIGELIAEVTNVAYCAKHTNGASVLYSRFIPRLAAWQGPKNKEVIFWLDCSGSMEGRAFENAKMALELCLRSLSEGDTFSFVLFGSDYLRIQEEGSRPFEYTDKSLAKALNRIKITNASMGGTELYQAVKELLKHAGENGAAQEWVLLTDGGVSDPEKVIKHVAGSKIKPRIFTFGIGDGASSSLLKGLARVSGGSCEMILNEIDISESVLRHFARIDQPRVEKILIDIAGADYDAAEPLQPVFEGDGWNAIARLKEQWSMPETVTFSAIIEGEEVSYTAPVIDLGNWNALGCLWASKKVRFLEDTMPERGSNQLLRMQAKNQKEAVGIGLDFGIMSSQTSFIGIEVRKEGDKWTEKPVYSIVPSQIAIDRFYQLSMNGLHFDEVRFQRQGKSLSIQEQYGAEQPWYLQLVEIMASDGRFEITATVEILRKKFSTIGTIIQELSAEPGLKGDLDIVATIIAVSALESDVKAAKACKKAINKARQALIMAGVDMKLLDRVCFELDAEEQSRE